MVSNIHKALGSLALFNAANAVIPPFYRPEPSEHRQDGGGGSVPTAVLVQIGSDQNAGSGCGFIVTLESEDNGRHTIQFDSFGPGQYFGNSAVYADYAFNPFNSLVMISAANNCGDASQIQYIQIAGTPFYLEDTLNGNQASFWIDGNYNTEYNNEYYGDYFCVNGVNCKLTTNAQTTYSSQNSHNTLSTGGFNMPITMTSDVAASCGPVVTIADPQNRFNNVTFPSMTVGPNTQFIYLGVKPAPSQTQVFISSGACNANFNISNLYVNSVQYALQSALSTNFVQNFGNSYPCTDNFGLGGGQTSDCSFGVVCGLVMDQFHVCQ